MRRRDSILEALVAFRKLSPRISVNEIMAFLYTCENEGLSVQELAFVAQMSQSAASRSLRSLGPPGSPLVQAAGPGPGLRVPASQRRAQPPAAPDRPRRGPARPPRRHHPPGRTDQRRLRPGVQIPENPISSRSSRRRPG